MYRIYYIYDIRNKDNILYVGSTKNNIKKRFNQHKRMKENISNLTEYLNNEGKYYCNILLIGEFHDDIDRYSREAMWILYLNPKYKQSRINIMKLPRNSHKSSQKLPRNSHKSSQNILKSPEYSPPQKLSLSYKFKNFFFFLFNNVSTLFN